MFTPREHQKANSEILFNALKGYGCGLDASEVGTGKTFTSLWLCKRLGATPAIVTRKSVSPAWAEACKTIGVEPLFIAHYEQLLTDGFRYTKKSRKTVHFKKNGGFDRTFTEFEGWQIPEKRTIFIYDEAQALRHAKSFASKSALGAAKEFKTLLLSATPFQTPLECEAIGKILKLFPNSEGCWRRFLFEHGCRRNIFKGWDFIGDKKDPLNGTPGANAAKGQEIMARIHETLFPSRGVRTRRTDIPGFPESLISAEAIDTGHAEEIMEIYLREIEERKKADHAKACEGVDEEFHHLVDVLPIVADIRERQRAEVLKAPAMAEMARDAAAQGHSVALFVTFDTTVEILSKLLETNLLIRGDHNGGKENFNRQRAVERFQANLEPFVVVNSAAGGAGLSLHDPTGRVPRTAIISPPFSAVMLRQIQGRVWRLGGAWSRQRLVFAAGTIEERVMRRVRARNCNLDALLDSDLDIMNDHIIDI